MCQSLTTASTRLPQKRGGVTLEPLGVVGSVSLQVEWHEKANLAAYQ